MIVGCIKKVVRPDHLTGVACGDKIYDGDSQKCLFHFLLDRDTISRSGRKGTKYQFAFAKLAFAAQKQRELKANANATNV